MDRLTELYRLIATRHDIAALPQRVQDEIRKRERANVMLARMIQLAIIVLFCLLYAASRQTASSAFSPAPYVLAAYLALSLVGLAWAWQRETPPWASYLSILFDFGLLYGLMLSFHLQYQQPASFILKAPSLLYVFIFIALRALQFHPRHVITAGLTAAAGWAGLIVYVTGIDPGDNMITRSYVEYLTSNSILIGAEIDKIISILFVTAILAVAVNGSGNLLVAAVSEQAAADRLSLFFDRSVASGIRNAATELRAGEGERREAVVMNVDIRGFTALAGAMEPSQVMRLLSAYQSRMVPLIRAHGGVIDKFMGDGVLATFGIDGEPGAAARALEAAAALLAEQDAWAQGEELAALRIGIGIAAGPVAYGAVGIDDRLEMTVIGPSVNLAARLEKLNKALGSRLACDAGAWRAGRDQGFGGLRECVLADVAVDGLDRAIAIAYLPDPDRLAIPAEASFA